MREKTGQLYLKAFGKYYFYTQTRKTVDFKLIMKRRSTNIHVVVIFNGDIETEPNFSV